VLVLGSCKSDDVCCMETELSWRVGEMLAWCDSASAGVLLERNWA
jgi:hypothetical protein